MLGIDDFVHEPRIAYFTMEIALRNEMNTYSGGLGVLAGDTMRSAADLEHVILPLYNNDHAGWVAIMKGAICKNASFFNSHRMMRRYVTEAYIH
jgi:glucan phosphorylase